MSLPRPQVPFGFLAHSVDLLNHFRPVLEQLPAGSFELIRCVGPDDIEPFEQVTSRHDWPFVTLEALEDVETPYDCLISNHPMMLADPEQTKRLGRRNVRFMYGLGKNRWQFAEWNALYDAILCFGPYQVAHLAPVTDAVLIPMGYPRFDGFFTLRHERHRLIEEFGGDPSRATIVWLPTWNQLSSVGHYDEDIAQWADRYNVFVKVHPGMLKVEPERIARLNALPFTTMLAGEADNMPLFAVADLVLADYGGSAFGAIYTDRNLLLLDVPGAEHDEYLGEDSPELLLREHIPSIRPGEGRAIGPVLHDAVMWERQRHVRRALRAGYFFPFYGFSGRVAADALINIHQILDHGDGN